MSDLLPMTTPNVLEAGGGKRCQFGVPGARVTVIDIDEDGLALNRSADEKIVASLESYDYGERRFDLIICWDVLEHLKRPADALQRLAGALSPGGVIVAKGPVRRSMKALATRFTPYWMHVAFYRRILGASRAGEPGYAPFRTEFAASADDTEIIPILEQSGLRIIAWRRFVSDQVAALRSRNYPLYFGYRLAAHGVRGLTLGRYGGLNTDFWLLAKNDPHATPNNSQ